MSKSELNYQVIEARDAIEANEMFNRSDKPSTFC